MSFWYSGNMEDSAFFDYICDRCGAPVCERVQIMNLALDLLDSLECLSCLAKRQDSGEAELADTLRDYIDSRECFSTPWRNFQAQACPRIASRTCHCQDLLTERAGENVAHE